MTKTCPTCGKAKPLEQFHKDKSKADGLCTYCKPCMITRQREYAMRPSRTTAPDGLKRCQGCKETKPNAEFHKSSREYDGLNRRCKNCSYLLRKSWAQKYPEKAAHLARKWRKENPDRARDHGLKQNYGLPMGEYDKMLAHQCGKCAICQRSPTAGTRLHVDHCHDTGFVRGLLCHGCNVSIGHFLHDTEILFSAIAYLDYYRSSEGSGIG